MSYLFDAAIVIGVLMGFCGLRDLVLSFGGWAGFRRMVKDVSDTFRFHWRQTNNEYVVFGAICFWLGVGLLICGIFLRVR